MVCFAYNSLMHTGARTTSFVPWLGWVAFIGVLYFFLIAATLQFLRPDYSFVGTPLSFYLLGPHGGWLHGAFYILAAAIVLLTSGYYLCSFHDARTVTTLILFLVGASGVAVTAIFPTDTNNTLTRHGVIHVVGAVVAFLCVSVAMLVQSWYFRRDAGWRRHFRVAIGLAVFEFVVLWIYALSHFGARGLMEKFTILLILLWLALAAWWLRQTSPQAASITRAVTTDQTDRRGGKRDRRSQSP